MNPDDDEVYEDDQLLLDLMQMAQQAEDENPGRGLHTLPVRRERSESLEELLAKPQAKLHIPTIGSTWRNVRTLKTNKVIHVTSGTARILVTLDDGKPASRLSEFQALYEKYTPSAKAGGGDPVEGEEWQSIHTSLKANILEVKQGRKHLEVRFSSNGQEKTMDLPAFLASWRRIKNVGKWHVGALKGLL